MLERFKAITMTKDELKKQVATAALDYIDNDDIVGVGTGTTVNFFIEALATIKNNIEGAVASSQATAQLLKKHNIPVLDANSVAQIPVYIDGADEATKNRHLIKGGGGALTGEKILVANSKKFVCMVTEDKIVDVLGKFGLPIEVIPMARSYVAREIVKLDGDPVYRSGYVTDHGNIILDVFNLSIIQAVELEQKLNEIAGVVTNGLFAKRHADILLIGSPNGTERIAT